MLRAVVIDDEKNALDVLELLITKYCKDVKIEALCQSGEAGIAAIRTYKPDLVFLDIEMPHKSGFDVINETADYLYNVIFTTAYNQFAVKAFKVSALDYLLKPIDIAELQEAVQKGKNKTGTGLLNSQLQLLISNMQQPVVNKVALPVGDAMQFFYANEIVRCESDSNYTHVYIDNGKKLTVSKTLKDVEQTLDGLGFFRVHQSHLINMNHVTKFIKSDGAYVVMTDGTNIGISRSRKELFMECFRKL